VSGSTSTVSGGYKNTAGGACSFIGGGQLNRTSGIFSSVLGGSGNTVSASFSSILAGSGNTITSANTTSFIIGSNITADMACATFVNKLSIKNVPTSSAGLPSGAIWSNAGVLNIVP